MLKLFALNVKLCLVYSRKGKTRAQVANIYFILFLLREGGWSMKRYSRFLTASGALGTEQTGERTTGPSFALLCYFIKSFFSPYEIQSLYSALKFFVCC